MLAPGRKEADDADSMRWLMNREPKMHLSVVTVIEIESGIQQLIRTGSTRRRSDLSRWLTGLFATFGDRILPVDGRVAMTAGRLDALSLGKGHGPGLADIVIAATAEVHALTVLTRNLRHFLPLGIPALDPVTNRDQAASQ
jgi:toxin FitB